MNVGGTWTTAIVRASYIALLTGLIAGLTVYQQNDNARDAVIVGLLTALPILLTRGAAEGAYDAGRNAAGDVKPSDVTPNP